MMKRLLCSVGAMFIAACSQNETVEPAIVETPAAAEAPGPSTVKGIHHVKLSVRDLDRSLAFYRDATGFSLVERSELAPSAALDAAAGLTGLSGARALIRGPNGQIELVQFDEDDRVEAPIVPANGPGATHICFQSPLDNPLYDRFRALGSEPVTRGGKPVDMLGRNYFYMYSRDPDGVMFEVEHASTPAFTDEVWFGHVAYATHDMDRFADFYAELVGHAPYRRAEDIGGPTFDQVAGFDDVNFDGGWISVGNMIIEMWEYHNPPTVPATVPRPVTAVGYSAVMYEVGDIVNDIRRIEAAGGEIVSGVDDVDGRKTVYARDPDGNLIGLIQLEEGSDQSVERLKQITWGLN